MHVCVVVWRAHHRQDSEAVEDQWEGQAPRRLQPEGWGRTDPRPVHHHQSTGKKSHCPRCHVLVCQNFAVWLTGNLYVMILEERLGRTQFVRQCTTFVHKWNENTVFHLSALQWNTPHFTDVKVRVRYIRHLYLSIRVEAGWLNEAMRLNTSQNHLKWMQKWNIWSQQSSPYVLNKPVFLERPTHGIPARRVQISWLSRNLALSLYAMIAFNPA